MGPQARVPAFGRGKLLRSDESLQREREPSPPPHPAEPPGAASDGQQTLAPRTLSFFYGDPQDMPMGKSKKIDTETYTLG